MAQSKITAAVTISDGKVMDGRVNLKIFANLEHGNLSKVDALVMHQTGGDSAKSTLEGYKSASIGAHFLIDKDGTIYQTVRVTQKAFHVGKIRAKCMDFKSCTAADQSAINTILAGKKIPYSKKVGQIHQHEESKAYPNRYPTNDDSIGIEVASKMVEGAYEDPTDKQAVAVKWLVSELLAAFNLKTSDIYRHPEVSYKDATEAQHVEW